MTEPLIPWYRRLWVWFITPTPPLDPDEDAL